MSSVSVAPYLSIPDSRARRLQDELQFALRQVSKAELAAWGIASGGRFGVGLWRRGKSLYSITKRVAGFAYGEVRDGVNAQRDHRFSDHAKDRGKRLLNTGERAWSWTRVKAQGFPKAVRSLTERPAEMAPRMLGAAIGFLTGSGGFDANGGVLSMSAKGCPRDNAQAESFFKTLKTEEVHLQEYESMLELEASLERYVDQTYNEERLHSSLGYMPPAEFERQWKAANQT